MNSVAPVMLVLAILQGTSFTLTLAVRGPLASDLVSTLVTVLWIAMYLYAVSALLLVRGLNWLTWMVRFRLPLILLLAGAVFSSAWSVAPHLTLERSVHLIGTSLLAVYLGFSLPLARILKISAVTLGLLMLASALSALFIPALGLDYYEGRLVWAGVMASKNTLGFWAAVSVLLLISLSTWTLPQSVRVFYLLLAGISLICLYYSVSATSVLALLSAGLFMLYVHTTITLRLGMLPMLLLGALVAGLTTLAVYYIDAAELIGRSGDLTGRGDVWTQTWQLILDRPLTGYGFGTLWYPTSESVWIQQSLTDFSWEVAHAHNGLLQIASEIGLPLTVLSLLVIVQQLVELIHCQYQRQLPGTLFVLGFTLALLMSNYSEARFLSSRELYWIWFIALPVSMLQKGTLLASTSGKVLFADGLSRNARASLRNAREMAAQRRTIKQRLKTQRRVRIINEVAAGQTRAEADHVNTSSPAADSAYASVPDNSNQAMSRKLARRQRKAG